MKKTINYIKDKTVTIEMDVQFASLFQNFLIYFITTAKDPNEVITGYQKIEKLLEGEEQPVFTEFQTYLYCITALCQNIKKCAIEQGAAKEVDVPDDVADKSKQVANMILQGDKSNKEDMHKLYMELVEDMKKLS